MSTHALVGIAKTVGIVVGVLVLIHMFAPKQLKDYTGTV